MIAPANAKTARSIDMGGTPFKIEQWTTAVVFKIEHPAHTHALKISVLPSRAKQH
jgi:hypothetical protein